MMNAQLGQMMMMNMVQNQMNTGMFNHQMNMMNNNGNNNFMNMGQNFMNPNFMCNPNFMNNTNYMNQCMNFPNQMNMNQFNIPQMNPMNQQMNFNQQNMNFQMNMPQNMNQFPMMQNNNYQQGNQNMFNQNMNNQNMNNQNMNNQNMDNQIMNNQNMNNQNMNNQNMNNQNMNNPNMNKFEYNIYKNMNVNKNEDNNPLLKGILPRNFEDKSVTEIKDGCNDESQLVNIIMRTNTGISVPLKVPLTFSFKRLFQEFAKKFHVNDNDLQKNLLFLFDASSIPYNDETPLSAKFVSPAKCYVIIVVDRQNVLGAE